MARGNLKIENYVPAIRQNEGIYSHYDIATTGTITGSNVTSITTNLALSGTLSVAGVSTLHATTLATGNLTLTTGSMVISANAAGISFTGTGANGGVLTNLKNQATGSLSGTARAIEISIGGTPYYFLVSPVIT